MQPLLRPEERKSITFEDDFSDIIGVGNLDYTGSYEEDLRKVRALLEDLQDDTLYYDTVTADKLNNGVFVPSPPSPPSSGDVKIVVKGLPGAGPRLQPERVPSGWGAPAPPPTPLCDDKVSL